MIFPIHSFKNENQPLFNADFKRSIAEKENYQIFILSFL